jgi:hypothetical protein
MGVVSNAYAHAWSLREQFAGIHHLGLALGGAAFLLLPPFSWIDGHEIFLNLFRLPLNYPLGAKIGKAVRIFLLTSPSSPRKIRFFRIANGCLHGRDV